MKNNELVYACHLTFLFKIFECHPLLYTTFWTCKFMLNCRHLSCRKWIQIYKKLTNKIWMQQFFFKIIFCINNKRFTQLSRILCNILGAYIFTKMNYNFLLDITWLLKGYYVFESTSKKNLENIKCIELHINFKEYIGYAIYKIFALIGLSE